MPTPMPMPTPVQSLFASGWVAAVVVVLDVADVDVEVLGAVDASLLLSVVVFAALALVVLDERVDDALEDDVLEDGGFDDDDEDDKLGELDGEDDEVDKVEDDPLEDSVDELLEADEVEVVVVGEEDEELVCTIFVCGSAADDSAADDSAVDAAAADDDIGVAREPEAKFQLSDLNSRL